MSDDANQDLIAARRLYAQSQQGVLSTISKSMDGFPFGSVITFAPVSYTHLTLPTIYSV